MKIFGAYKKAILTAVLVFFWLAAPVAQADYFEFVPNDDEPLAVENDWDRIPIDLVFVVPGGQGPDIIYYDYDLIFDAGELSFAGVAGYLPGFQAFVDPVVSGNRIRITADGSRSVQNGDIFAQLEFDLIAPAFDGAPDIELVSQIGTTGVDLRGMLLGDFSTTLQYGGALGPDVGLSPVPVPGAVWLLGGGLLGMAGLKRSRSIRRGNRS